MMPKLYRVLSVHDTNVHILADTHNHSQMHNHGTPSIHTLLTHILYYCTCTNTHSYRIIH